MESPKRRRIWDRSRLGAVTGFYAVLSAAAVLWHAADQESLNVLACGDRAGARAHVQSLVAGLVLGGATVWGFRVLFPHVRWLQRLRGEVRALLGRPSPAEILLIAVASAVGEELFFRGAMMDAWGVFPSTGVFALLHVPPRRDLWPWTASAFVLGLAFAGLSLWTGSLAGPIAAHFVINWRNLTFVTREGGGASAAGSPSDGSGESVENLATEDLGA